MTLRLVSHRKQPTKAVKLSPRPFDGTLMAKAVGRMRASRDRVALDCGLSDVVWALLMSRATERSDIELVAGYLAEAVAVWRKRAGLKAAAASDRHETRSAR